MLLTKQEIEEFKAIAKKEHGVDLTDNQAQEQGGALMDLGQHLFEEAMKERKLHKRLKEEPDGFHLEGREIYHCVICQSSIVGRTGWWDALGYKCLACQKNVKEGVVPAKVCTDRKSWLDYQEMKEVLGISYVQFQKLLASGTIKVRELRDFSGEEYFRVFLKEENKQFEKEIKTYELKNKPGKLIYYRDEDGEYIQTSKSIKKKTMKIAIIGTGGVGGYFGGLLAKAGHNVTFVARGDHGKALKEKGLIVKSVVGDFAVNPVKVVEKISELDEPDLVLFTVKTYDTDQVAQELDKVIHDETIIITFQNGVENDLKIKKLLTKGHVYPGVCYVISARTQPGVIEQTGGLRKLIFGDRENSYNQSLKKIELLMKNANIDADLSDDITRDIWKKFVFITAFSGMTALARKPIGEILNDPETLKGYELIVRESIAVAKALGINLPADIFQIVMKTTFNTALASKSSLLHDIEKERKNEIETLNGTLVRLAEKVNVEVPMNKKVYIGVRK